MPTIIDVITDNSGKVLMLNNKALVYSIPDEYTKINYLASTGTQYINTGIKLTSNDVIYEWEGRDDSTTGSSLFGSEHPIAGGRAFTGILYGANNKSRTCWIGHTNDMSIGYSSSDNKFHKWSLNISSNHTVYLVKDGTKLTEKTWTGDLARKYNIDLYCNSTNGNPSQHARVAYKYFKITDNGAVVFWGIPVKRNSDGVLGMYDLITKQFFVNKGTGSFVEG